VQVGMIVGEATPLSWDRWRHIVGLAERLGFSSLFRSDHYFNGIQKDAIDVYLSFVAAGLESSSLRFGPLVSPVTFREPVNVGRMAQQLDALSGGRFVLGLGVGWFEDEHRIYGLDYPSLGERYDRLADAIELMQVLWYDAPGHYQGRYYRLDGTDSRPHPPAGRPPILIGGNGPRRTLELVARFADEWNASGQRPDDYAASVATLERHCATIGRDPASIRRSMLLFTTAAPTAELSDLVARRAIDMFAPGSGLQPGDLNDEGGRPRVFVGSTEQLIDRCGRLAELGLSEVVFEHFCHERDDVPEWIAAEIAPALAGL